MSIYLYQRDIVRAAQITHVQQGQVEELPQILSELLRVATMDARNRPSKSKPNTKQRKPVENVQGPMETSVIATH